MMLGGKTFKANREFDIARADNILNLEVSELGIKAQLLNDSSIFAACELRVVLGLGTSHDHLAGSKDECGGLWLTNSHYDSSKSLAACQYQPKTFLEANIPLDCTQRCERAER